jgi:fatty-acyl-CoA synthase
MVEKLDTGLGWGPPWTATLSGVKQVYSGRYDPAFLVKLIKTEGVTFTHDVPTILQMLLGAATTANTDLAGLKMVIGGSELPRALARQGQGRSPVLIFVFSQWL